MKKILFLLFFAVPLLGFTQTKFTSLNDACTKSANSQVAKQSAQYWWLSFTVNNTVYVNNNASSNLKLEKGFYYNPQSSQAFQVNSRGKIVSIQGCSGQIAPNAPAVNSLSGIVGTIFSGTASEQGTVEIFDANTNAMIASVQTSSNSPFTWSYTPALAGSFKATLGVTNKPISSFSSIWVISNSQNDNLAFEQNTLQAIVDGTNDVGLNTFGANRFPTTNGSPTVSNMAEIWFGDVPEYLNSTVHQLGLATAFGNNKLRTLTELTASKRYSWALGPEQYPLNNDGAGCYQRGIDEYNIWKTREVDKNGNSFVSDYFMWDNETSGWINNVDCNREFVFGFQQAAIDDGKLNHKTIHYTVTNTTTGEYMWPYSRYYYEGSATDGDMKTLFPWVKPEQVSVYRASNGIINSSWANKEVYFNVAVQYPKSNYPIGLQFWLRDNNNNIILDNYGDRTRFTTAEPTATIRGRVNRWNLPQPQSSPSGEDGPIKKYQHELHFGVYSASGVMLSTVYRIQSIANINGWGYDISNMPNSPIKTVCIWRDTQESNSWDALSEPLDKYTSERLTWFGLITTNVSMWWNGKTNALGYSPNSADPYTAVNEGNTQIEGCPDEDFCDLHLGGIAQSLAIGYKAQMLNRQYGFFSPTDKLLFFTDPVLYRPNAEIMAYGRLQGNKVFLVAHEERLEYQENPVTVTISNAKNNTTFTRTIGHGEVLDEVFVFPNDTYSTSDIRIQYTSVKGNTVRVTGNLLNHTF